MCTLMFLFFSQEALRIFDILYIHTPSHMIVYHIHTHAYYVHHRYHYNVTSYSRRNIISLIQRVFLSRQDLSNVSLKSPDIRQQLSIRESRMFQSLSKLSTKLGRKAQDQPFSSNFGGLPGAKSRQEPMQAEERGKQLPLARLSAVWQFWSFRSLFHVLFEGQLDVQKPSCSRSRRQEEDPQAWQVRGRNG